MKKLLISILLVMVMALPAIGQEDPMECDVLVRATDGSNNYLKGYVVTVKNRPCVWGTREYLPDFIHMILTDCECEQVYDFLGGWAIKFTHTVLKDNPAGYRILVEVDPAYISASEVGKTEIKDAMQDWAIGQGFTIQSFTSSSMTIDIPKPASLLEIKADFADIFNSTLDIRRYYFHSADVDGVVQSGGEITLTKQQALDFIIDKLEE